MENQITRSPTTKKVIEDFKAKGTNLSEEEAEKYIDLLYFFSEQTFKLYNTSKTYIPVELPTSNQKKPIMQIITYSLRRFY